MRKIRTILFALVTLVCYSNLNKATAQLNLGAGISYGTEIERAGLNLRGGYLVGDRLNIRGDGNFFRTRTTGSTRTRWQGVNLNASYWLRTGERFIVYPLAGLNVTTLETRTNIEEPVRGTVVEAETEMGLNLGGGIAYQMNCITPFAEGKYVTGDFGQGVFNFGLFYLFNQ